MALKIYKKRRNGYAVYHGNIHASSCNKGCLIKRVRDYLGQEDYAITAMGNALIIITSDGIGVKHVEI